MPSATLKEKTEKTTRANTKPTSSTSVKSKAKNSQKNTRPSKEVLALQGQVKLLTANFDKIESKLNTLIGVLHSQLNDHMRYGPEGLAREIKKARLLD
tara:strand:+ start:29306 stop:29599 length:294 start_codon:yes stop_codon:yes gene_type:complete